MKRAAIVLLGMTCAPKGSTPPSEPEPVASSPAPAATPEPPSAPAPEPVATTQPEPSEPPAANPKPAQPPPNPLKLSNEQLERARAVQRHVAAASTEYDIDPNLLNGIIWSESKFNPRAHNKSGARGLMQLMPRTGRAMAKRLGRNFRPYDAKFSVQAGALLLSILLEKFDGDEKLALFGYARGGGRVRQWQREGGPIPEGVIKFIARVTRAKRTFEALGFPESAT